MTALADRLLMPFDERYEPARLAAIWNGRKTTRRPAAIVHSRDASDVQAAVRLAAHNGWRVSIRSGGHSWVATGVRDDALLLDLSGMNEITLEVDNARATLQPAAQGVALNALLAQNGLAFPTGHCPSVGVGGFLLGGGYGWNSRKLGPACMSVDAIDVVLADGSLVHATDETHPDLMWAARGSGPGFFGVITRYYVRLHPGYDQVLRSVLVVPEEVRDEALAWSYDVLPETSRSLEIAGKVAYTPGVARPTTSLIAVGFCRDETPEQVFAAFENCPLRDKAITLVDRAPTSIAELYAFTEVGMPQGRRYAVDGVWTSATARDILQRGAPILDTVPNAESFLFWITIPGIGRPAAEIVIAETGGDMDFFATAGHLASWIGVCPGMNESAGVNKSGHTRRGNANLKRVLGTAAMAAIKRKDSYYAVYYRRIAARRGAQRALVAVMHKIVTAIWHILHDDVTYRDLGADYFTKRDPQRAIRRMTREANSLGLTIRFDPIGA